MRWFWLLCLTVGAVTDMRERTVSCRLLAVCGIIGLVYMAAGNLWDHAPGMVVGAVILMVSRVTGGAVGEGDGWFLLVTACYLTTGEVWLLLTGGFAVSWIWSMGLILYRLWQGKRRRRETLPFLACMWPAAVWIIL